MIQKSLLLLVSILFFCSIDCISERSVVDLIIFSFNRPMQLYSLLESIKLNCEGYGKIDVICKKEGSVFKNGYQIVESSFPFVQFHYENSPEQFYNLLLTNAFNSTNNYISFIVDDVVVKDAINLSECVLLLEESHSYAFYLRLGLNIKSCYMQKKDIVPPTGSEFKKNTFIWKFNDSRGDWAFPNNFDMTIYKKKDIKRSLFSVNPSLGIFFESEWNKSAPMNRTGICYKSSKIVNVTINTVYNANVWQFTDAWKQQMDSYSPEELCNKFLDGYKIDIHKLYGINNVAPHMEWAPIFKER